MDSMIASLLTEQRVVSHAAVSSKKKTLELLGTLLADNMPESSADDIYERLLNRERMGSTGIGEGIAIPHCRLKQCDETIGALLQLDQPIDFDSIDKQPVDLVFALIVPEEACDEHLQTLSALAKKFNEPQYRKALRQANADESLYLAAIS